MPLLNRGFKYNREHIKNNRGALNRFRDCLTCDCNIGDKTVNCTNKNVVQFDMTTEEDTGRTYCTYWRPPVE
jgi:hypothetical protein